jgi:uncharacterized repeat protein (TIGR01451 family)
MFRKLVANLPFSPALVGQLGFYAQRLKKEHITRRLGLIFTVLALVVQSFAIIRPPEAANAASPSNLVYGGIDSVDDLLRVYDNRSHDYKDIMDYAGVTRAELAGMSHKVVYVCSTDRNVISFGRQHQYSTAQGEIKHVVPRNNGGTSTVYSRPLYLFDSVNGRTNCYDAYVGQSQKAGWFAIMRKCGNLFLKKNIHPAPQARLAATCNVIQGWAYDGRQSDVKVKVIIYAGGPPGKGKQIASLVANRTEPEASGVGAGHGFSVAVPNEYRIATQATPIYGVMVPLAGWSSSTVPFSNTASVPGNCIKPTPVASCSTIQTTMIERTKFRFSGSAEAANGAKVTGYQYTVTDISGKKVYDKLYTSDKLTHQSDIVEIKATGTYKVSVVVKTTLGDKTDQDCAKELTVTPPAVCPLNPSLAQNSPECKPCPGDATIWYKDARCASQLAESKQVANLTLIQADANGKTARPGDRIEYTLRTTNVGNISATAAIEEDLTDVLEYAKVTDLAGGELKEVADIPNTAPRKVLTWANVEIKPGQTDIRKVVVQINDTIASTPRGSGDPESFNCVITNSYGNATSVNMECPGPKLVESAVSELPSTGPTENAIFGALLLMVVTYFYARSKQMNKEIRLIRHDFNMGTI